MKWLWSSIATILIVSSCWAAAIYIESGEEGMTAAKAAHGTGIIGGEDSPFRTRWDTNSSQCVFEILEEK